MLIHFRHPHHVKYLGGCFERGKLTNVMEKLRSWGGVVSRQEFGWHARLCAALRLARLVEFWSRTPNGAHVHCDFFTHQFAFDNRYAPAMIDVDGLQPAPIGNNSRCTPDDGAPPASSDSPLRPSRACRGKCWKTPLWPDRLGANDESLDELQCDTRIGRCVGYSTPFNVYSFGQALLTDLFLPQNLDTSTAPSAVLDAVQRIARGATAPALTERWSIGRVITELAKLDAQHAPPGLSCDIDGAEADAKRRD